MRSLVHARQSHTARQRGLTANATPLNKLCDIFSIHPSILPPFFLLWKFSGYKGIFDRMNMREIWRERERDFSSLWKKKSLIPNSSNSRDLGIFKWCEISEKYHASRSRKNNKGNPNGSLLNPRAEAKSNNQSWPAKTSSTPRVKD